MKQTPLTLFCSVLALSFSACSMSSQPTNDASSDQLTLTDQPATDSNTPSDTSTDAPDASSCSTLDPSSAPLVTPMFRLGTSPTPMGGTTVDGTYVLTNITAYTNQDDAGTPTLPTQRGFLRIQGNRLELALITAGTTPSTLSGTFTSSQNQLSFTADCPRPLAPMPLSYTNNTTEFFLYTPASLPLELRFQKQ